MCKSNINDYKNPNTPATLGFLIFMLPQKLTKELVVARLISETTRFNLSDLLEKSKSISRDPEALTTNYALLLQLRGIWDYLDKQRKEEDKEQKDIIATRKEGYDEIMNPIAEILDAADPHIFEANTKILLEERQVGSGIQKQIDNRDSLAEFINTTIRSIIAAPDNKELVRIQKLIGSEKSRKSKYGEYEAITEETCDALLSLIDGRKKLITENDKWEKQLAEALASDDQPAVVQIKGMMMVGKRELEENAATISENAFKKVSDLPIAGYHFISKAVKPRLSRWSWRVDDMELLYKKSPEFVIKEPNTKAINAFMKQKTEAGELDEYGDNVFNGLVLYKKPFYVAVKMPKDAQ